MHEFPDPGEGDVPYSHTQYEAPLPYVEEVLFIPTATSRQVDEGHMEQAPDKPAKHSEAHFELTSAQRESLNSVDLQLHFGNHAYPYAILDHGRVELAVDDRDYAGMEGVAWQLDAARGDVLAREGYGYSSEWDMHTWLDTLLDWELRGSPHISPEDAAMLKLPLDGPMDEQARDAFMDSVTMLRAKWLISPVDYGSILANIKGVPVYYADANSKDVTQWYKKLEASMEGLPTIAQLVLYSWKARGEQDFRDTRTLVKLAAIAEGMQTIAAEKPILAYVGGSAHQKNIEQLLGDHNVMYASHAFSPDRRGRYRRDMMRDVGHLVMPFVDSSNERYQKLWVANAEDDTA